MAYNDEFDGIGGSYLLDPKTGKRIRIDPQPEPEQAATNLSTVKEEDDDHVAAE